MKLILFNEISYGSEVVLLLWVEINSTKKIVSIKIKYNSALAFSLY